MPKITDKTALTAPALEDVIHVVDVSDTTSGAAGTSKKVTLQNIINLGLAYNDIGVVGQQGFGVGLCPPNNLPIGMSRMPGTETRGHDNYGNYQYQDGSVVCYVPAHWIKIGTGSNGLLVNVIDVKKYSTYASKALANAAGYFLPRCFTDGGLTKPGYFIDKYSFSKNAWGSGFIASSIKNGLPLSAASTHNPIADLTACTVNEYYEAFNAAHARDGVNGAVNADSRWFVESRFIRVNMAQLSLAHGQTASAATYCAWYDGAGVTNFPKGNNNNALRDTNDTSVLYATDGYSNCGLTGSGSPFAKTTHNGQNCGVCDLNGNMYGINIGVTSEGTKYYVAKEAAEMRKFTAGNTLSTDHWGSVGIAANMQEVSIPFFTATEWLGVGSGANQVFSEVLTGNGALLRSLGLPMDADGISANGINQYGLDKIYSSVLRNELCVISGLYWGSGSTAGVWGSSWNASRSLSYHAVSCRFACFPV